MEPEQRLSLGPTAAAEGDGDGRGGVGEDSVKAPRLPRWTRQEILVLIQGKRVAEGRSRRGRGGAGGSGSSQVESKWASVSSYCRRHGVNRGPVQCRKRWSNLAGDFKKIKEWEAKVRGQAAESFWVMRNDLRRERRLPGFFDREVYDILDGGTGPPAPMLALALAPAAAEESEEADEIIFDSGRSAAAEDGLFSDFEQEEGGGSSRSPRKAAAAAAMAAEAEEVPTPTPLRISSKSRGEVYSESIPILGGCQEQGMSNGNDMNQNPELEPTSKAGSSRKRPIVEVLEEETLSLQTRLVNSIEKNCKLISEQLLVQDRNSRLDRDQRKDQANGLLAVLGKLADALGKIADKL